MADTEKPQSYPSDDQLQMAIANGQDLTKTPVEFERCPVCNGIQLVKLPADWQARVNAGARILIVGCGNPWHYAGMERPDDR